MHIDSAELRQTVRIDTSKIPDFQRIELAKGALKLVEKVFSQPGEEERYQEWLKKKRAAQQAARREEVRTE